MLLSDGQERIQDFLIGGSSLISGAGWVRRSIYPNCPKTPNENEIIWTPRGVRRFARTPSGSATGGVNHGMACRA